jgi:beta-N-acetylhexosaminidase
MSNTSLSLGGQFLIMGVPGAELDSATASVIEAIQPAGFILFGRNIKSPTQLRALTDSLRALVRHEPIITIDQEGGRVSRLKEIGNEPPSAKQLRDQLPLIAQHGRLTGRLLRLFGFNLDLCPVLDVSFDDEADNSLRNRTYGLTPEQVVRNVTPFTQALRAEGILSCGKHFPGYAAAGLDPHHELPVIPRTRAELEACEWIPFRKMLGLCDTMMIGHAVYPDVDPSGIAASISPRVITEILRGEFGYTGCVMTDDMDMGAILNHYGFADSMKRAILAGNDLILLCHRVDMAREAAEVLSHLTEAERQPAELRLAQLRRRLQKPYPFSLETWKRWDDEVYALREAALGKEAAATRSADDGKRSPVETY